MKLTSGFSVKAGIFVGLGAIILLLVVVVITAYIALDETRNTQRKMLEDNFGNLYDLPTLRANINAQRLAVAALLELPRDEWGPWIEELRNRRIAEDTIIDNLILRFRGDREESDKLGAFIETRDAYQRIQQSQIDLIVNGGKSDEARRMFIGVQMTTHAKMKSIVGQLEEMELAEARSMVKRTEANSLDRTRAFLIMGILGVLIAAVFAAYMNRTVLTYIREVKSAEADSARANRALKMLNACNGIVIRATDETHLLEDICREIVEVGGYKMTWVGYADDDRNKSVRPMAFAGEDGDYIEHARISWGDNERGRGPTGTCIRTGEVVIARDTSTEPGYDPWRYRASLKGYRSSATFPLKEGSRVYGAIMVYSSAADAFDDEELGLLKELADDLAYARTALRDQSGRIQAERKARENAAYARSLLDASIDPLLAVSPQGRIIDINPATEQLTGKRRSELLGSDFAKCFADPERALAVHRETLTKGFVREFLSVVRHPAGRSTEVVCNASVYRNDGGEVQGVFVIAREVMHA